MTISKYILLLLFPLLLIQSGCKKDYPKDIPDWLETMIKERKKECKREGCNCSKESMGCWLIEEWEYNGELYYSYTNGVDTSVTFWLQCTLYDSKGDVYCIDGCDMCSVGIDYPDCNGFYTSANKTRVIWSQTMN